MTTHTHTHTHFLSLFPPPPPFRPLSHSSINGGREGQGAYAASKAGIQCLTETIALEGKPLGVNAFCVMPRRTFTQLRQKLYPDEDPDTCLQPEQVAAVIISVATDSNPLLTGQSFWVR